jgi:hypothetical protein
MEDTMKSVWRKVWQPDHSEHRRECRPIVYSLVLVVFVFLFGVAGSGFALTGAASATLRLSSDSGPAVHYDTSRPLRSLKPSGTRGQAYPARRGRLLPSAFSRTSAPDTSGALQGSPHSSPLSPLIPSTSANFDGIGATQCGCAPPDPSGAAGPTQFVEVANTSLAVYSKTGSAVLGPEATNTLWSGFGGGCEKTNRGDATVLFDTTSQRWVVQQMSFNLTEGQHTEPAPPYFDCVAVSSSSDATGAWHRYAFEYASFPDYPKMGIWRDAYYASFNFFQIRPGEVEGAEACAFDRARMLNGEAATQQCFTDESGANTLMPATLDGATQPPAGEPEWFVALSPTEANALAYWKFHVDWSNQANTTFTGPTNLPVEAFSQACGISGVCIPQAETTNKLASLGDRLMFRLAYRNFGDHEAMVVSHSVATSGGSVGMRWYELRPSGGSLAVYQQGTEASENRFRWMGSIAMDRNGDMALGYSVSGGGLYPQIRYTGRLVGDLLGQMSQGEATIYEGKGSQTQSARWGDYTEMSVDPSDDCTFWYVNEYIPVNGAFNWHTRIASFKFPSCTGPYAATEPASSVTETAATLNGTVNPRGVATKYYFEYGTSPLHIYTMRTSEASAGSGNSAVPVSAAIAGLTPGKKYYFRVVATSSGGTTYAQESRPFLAATPFWAAYVDSGSTIKAYSPMTGTVSTSQAIMSHTSPSVAPATGGGYELAFQAPTGELELYSSATGAVVKTTQKMRSGTSPSIAALSGGGFEVAFQANTGELYTYSSATGSTTNTTAKMLSETSPSIAALSGGGFEVAFQANTGELYTYSSATGSTTNTTAKMPSRTSPSIAGLSGGGFEVAFLAFSGELYTYASATGSATNTTAKMLYGTSPSIAGLSGGGFEVAFQANTGELYTYSSATGSATNTTAKMVSETSPGIAGASGGAFVVAFESGFNELYAYTPTMGKVYLGAAALLTGTSPGIAE